MRRLAGLVHARQSFARRMGLALSGLGLVACDATFSLGAECVGTRTCVPPQDVTQRDGGAVSEWDGETPPFNLDASAGGGTGQDAGETGEHDAGDLSLARMPDFANPSFERTDGTSSGDLNLGASVSPWYHCLPPANLGFLRVEQNSEDVQPTDGSHFLAYGYPFVVDLPVAIFQQVQLKRGQRYAFMVDVQSKAGDEDIGLMVRGSSILCAASVPLAVTAYVRSGEWVSQCVVFTPTEDLTYIAFLPNNRNGIAVTNRLFLDNIRSDPSCQ